MASRGMGAINPSKMPKGTRKARRDDTDFTEFKEGGEVESSKERLEQVRKKYKEQNIPRLGGKSAAMGTSYPVEDWHEMARNRQSTSKAYDRLQNMREEEIEALAKRTGEEPYKRGGSVKKNWIAGAIKHKGALHEQMGVPQGQKIPAKKLASAAKKPGVMGKRARLAQTLKGLHKGK